MVWLFEMPIFMTVSLLDREENGELRGEKFVYRFNHI